MRYGMPSRILAPVDSSCMPGRCFDDITSSAECIVRHDGSRCFVAGTEGSRITSCESCIDSFHICRALTHTLHIEYKRGRDILDQLFSKDTLWQTTLPCVLAFRLWFQIASFGAQHLHFPERYWRAWAIDAPSKRLR